MCKRLFYTILILLILGIIFRGPIYRFSVTYKSVGQRLNYAIINHKLLTYVEENDAKNESTDDIKEIIKSALSITSKQLNFIFGKKDADPNKLIESKAANCIGYAAFFSTTCNHLLQQHKLSEEWIISHQIGKLYLFGIDVHQYIQSPFFKDHDFVTIGNKTTGEIFAVDPTINDYLFIDLITFEKSEQKKTTPNINKIDYYVELRGFGIESAHYIAENLFNKEVNPDAVTCHRFLDFQTLSKTQIPGSVKRIIVELKENKKEFSVMIFDRNGSQWRRILNAGTFRPDIPVNKLLDLIIETTVDLTFK